MKLAKLHPRHFWSTESGLTGLLIFLLGYLVVLNCLSEFGFGRLVARLFFSLIIVAGVLTTFKQRWLHGFAIVISASLVAHVTGDGRSNWFSGLLLLTVYLVMAVAFFHVPG